MSKCKVIAIANQKGGSGKTTMTVNLGIGLASAGKRGLLVDAGPQRDLTTSLGWPEQDNLSVTLATQMKKVIRDQRVESGKGILHHAEGVDLIPGRKNKRLHFYVQPPFAQHEIILDYVSVGGLELYDQGTCLYLQGWGGFHCNTLKELEQNGWLTQQRIRFENGRLWDVEYTIHEK